MKTLALQFNYNSAELKVTLNPAKCGLSGIPSPLQVTESLEQRYQIKDISGIAAMEGGFFSFKL